MKVKTIACLDSIAAHRVVLSGVIAAHVYEMHRMDKLVILDSKTSIAFFVCPCWSEELTICPISIVTLSENSLDIISFRCHLKFELKVAVIDFFLD